MAFLKIRRILPGAAALILVCGISVSGDSGRDKLNALLGRMGEISSLRANVTINNEISGTLSFKKPNYLHVKFSDGRVVSSNGRFLWFYSPARAIVGKQDLRGTSGGVFGLLGGYEEITQVGGSIRLKSPTKSYEEIVVTMNPDNTPKSLRMKRRGSTEYTSISFSGVQTNVGLSASLFNFSAPSSAQIVENPLNEKE
ncbi:outer membrane lipoprotein carrier protein LolA [Leptospira santarosai]|uniref:LolA family protein n=1 Tax=Leptospira santarosai TaxID=28183 RepID=UPI00077405F6|nr:outer membrane lipoprotein carrier protein LolA [Leptospira santarosai]MDI7186083.1 outer membrane lipoprotein carrier protein LolA [Leptospira santarosai]MDI7189472.1 outer membrane lipoprotein carrier protein LolA [Leptospira santarosai]MDI7201336.1 outer membrane lipoprotein carrier protein LolA [Leptospira santarosai]MDI7210626.1 outer membrane lipoprotein carrier protein LolA [Leptospira santarosai]MDI7213742.1 outer membrane lipoprotein carrier protein LolA [Leptospira santarosai]